MIIIKILWKLLLHRIYSYNDRCTQPVFFWFHGEPLFPLFASVWASSINWVHVSYGLYFNCREDDDLEELYPYERENIRWYGWHLQVGSCVDDTQSWMRKACESPASSNENVLWQSRKHVALILDYWYTWFHIPPNKTFIECLCRKSNFCRD